MTALARINRKCERQTRPLVRERERERARPISRNPQQSGSNKNVFVRPRWVLYSKTDLPTDVGCNIRLRLRLRSDLFVKQK
jgi:hypothetical protein